MAQSQWRDLGASSAPAVPDTVVNSTQINFGGHEWVVIGNKDKDIYKNEIARGTAISSGAYGGVEQPDDSVTLLSIKNDFAGAPMWNSVLTQVAVADATPAIMREAATIIWCRAHEACPTYETGFWGAGVWRQTRYRF
ncbi:hypothetical protein AGMMS50289_13790 [Betaproteobacteria bacterium]|nr:hypothetical protein AGMMS50289_13790 [Betaproteobacteria bacterium]